MMDLRIKFGNHFKAFPFFITTSVMILIGAFYIGWDLEAFLVMIAFYSIFIIPGVYLHIEYYLKNRGQRIEILEGAIILHDRNGQVTRYATQDLEKIILYKSASLDRNGIPLSVIEFYHYARILTTQGTEIIITSLLAPDVEEAIKKIKWVSYERKKRLFASLNFSIRLLPD